MLSLLGDHYAAESLYRRQLEIREERGEEGTSDLAECLEGYAHVLRETGRGDQAEPMAARARAIREQVQRNRPPHG